MVNKINSSHASNLIQQTPPKEADVRMQAVHQRVAAQASEDDQLYLQFLQASLEFEQAIATREETFTPENHQAVLSALHKKLAAKKRLEEKKAVVLQKEGVVQQQGASFSLKQIIEDVLSWIVALYKNYKNADIVCVVNTANEVLAALKKNRFSSFKEINQVSKDLDRVIADIRRIKSVDELGIMKSSLEVLIALKDELTRLRVPQKNVVSDRGLDLDALVGSQQARGERQRFLDLLDEVCTYPDQALYYLGTGVIESASKVLSHWRNEFLKGNRTIKDLSGKRGILQNLARLEIDVLRKNLTRDRELIAKMTALLEKKKDFATQRQERKEEEREREKAIVLLQVRLDDALAAKDHDLAESLASDMYHQGEWLHNTQKEIQRLEREDFTSVDEDRLRDLKLKVKNTEISIQLLEMNQVIV